MTANLPAVVHVHSEAWKQCPADQRLYIGRTIRAFWRDQGWGNRYTVKRHGRNRAIALYEADLLTDPVKLARLRGLRAYAVLGCWCKDDGQHDQACHGDVLVKYAALPDEQLDALIKAALEGSNDAG